MHKFTRTCEIEQDNLKQNQDEMKHWYENKVIVVLLIHCHPLEAKCCWPYVIESRLNDLNYISVIFILHVPNKCDGIVIIHHEWMKMYIIIVSKIKIRQVIFFFNCGLFFLIFVNV
jgi:hypothetical protein